MTPRLILSTLAQATAPMSSADIGRVIRMSSLVVVSALRVMRADGFVTLSERSGNESGRWSITAAGRASLTDAPKPAASKRVVTMKRHCTYGSGDVPGVIRVSLPAEPWSVA